ncbi:hypothetical protein BKA93DRAFT_747238 [Sparassis latifolia]
MGSDDEEARPVVGMCGEIAGGSRELDGWDKMSGIYRSDGRGHRHGDEIVVPSQAEKEEYKRNQVRVGKCTNARLPKDALTGWDENVNEAFASVPSGTQSPPLNHCPSRHISQSRPLTLLLNPRGRPSLGPPEHLIDIRPPRRHISHPELNLSSMDASIILHKYTLAEALLRIEIFTEPFDLILWKAWAVRMHILLVFMVQAQSKAASVGIILPLPHDIPVLAQVEIHLATARTVEAGRQMDFGLGHPPDGLPDIGTLRLRVETLRNAARKLYNVMRGITGRRELADGTLRRLRIIVEELEIAFGLIFRAEVGIASAKRSHISEIPQGATQQTLVRQQLEAGYRRRERYEPDSDRAEVGIASAKRSHISEIPQGATQQTLVRQQLEAGYRRRERYEPDNLAKFCLLEEIASVKQNFAIQLEDSYKNRMATLRYSIVLHDSLQKLVPSSDNQLPIAVGLGVPGPPYKNEPRVPCDTRLRPWCPASISSQAPRETGPSSGVPRDWHRRPGVRCEEMHANVNRHLAKADGSGGDEAQKAWIGELSHLVRTLEDHFQVLTAFGESDFDPREVNEIRTTFIDIVLYACMQSFASLHLPDPSQEEVDAGCAAKVIVHNLVTL